MKIDFSTQPDGLIPAIVQDANTHRVLTVGFMNKAAYKKTRKSGKVVFFSRSTREVSTNGNVSGNFLSVRQILIDCVAGSILILAIPNGPVCGAGKNTCFGEPNEPENYLFELERLIQGRKRKPRISSPTSRLFERGVNKISQKFGEEAVEFIIEAIDNNDELLKQEASDLLYHFVVLLAAKDIELRDVLEVLKRRRW